MKKLLFVNPLVSTDFICNKLLSNNIKIYAVFSSNPEKISQFVEAKKNFFTEYFFLVEKDANIENKLIKRIQCIGCDYILNGAEEETPFFDKISNLILPEFANSTSNSSFRYNKHSMQNKIAENGLTNIKEHSLTPLEILDQINLHTKLTHYPLFLKPQIGFANINSYIIDSKDMLIQKINYLVKLDTEKNRKYLLQQFIYGTEFFVNAFSINGKHYLSGVFRYLKQPFKNVMLYRYVDVETDNLIWNKFSNYIPKILNALEVKNGITHTELMMQPDGDIYLIELNNRNSGAYGLVSTIANLTNLKSEADLLIDFLNNTKCIESNYNNKKGYARLLMIYKFANTIIKSPDEKLKSLKSFNKLMMIKPINEYCNNNNSWSVEDTVGFIVLYSDDYSQIEEDSKTIFYWEETDQLV